MSGIQREVILHAPASYYVRDVRVIPRLAADNTNGTLTVDVDVRRHETSSGALTDLRVVAELFPESNKGRRLLPLAASTGAIPDPIITFEATVPGLAAGQEAPVSLGDDRAVGAVEPWSAERPALYRVLVTLYSGTTVVEARSVVIGFRRVDVTNPHVCRFRLRGRPCARARARNFF